MAGGPCPNGALSVEGLAPLARTLLANKMAPSMPIARVWTITSITYENGGTMTLLDDFYQWSKRLPGRWRDTLMPLFHDEKLSANDVRELMLWPSRSMAYAPSSRLSLYPLIKVKG